ncbi:ATP-binding protein [uncultured Jannaschia sp.]|uniref:ATP-binding protein n=1 Tax=uncultured Jannaschia sp. TaxID=293347 RepID=UPI00260C3654|nr:ATP-binding protein [uncultured Jannaschia sp.]
MEHTVRTDVDDGALLNALLDTSMDAIVVADASGRIIRVNGAASRLFRQRADRMVGRDVAMLMPDDVASRHGGYMSHHLETGESRIIDIGREVTGLRGDGTTFPLHLSIGRTDAPTGPIFVAIMHDQTARRAAEEAATRSQRMDAIGQMTGGVAHDFNNLLTVIVGNLELLESKISDAGGRDMLADALSAAEAGADLTSRLLLFARKGELKPVEIHLADAVEETMRLLRRTLSAQLRVEMNADPAAWPVHADPVQLQTAIINLALNAQDAMPKGGRLRLDVANVMIEDDFAVHDFDIAPGRYVRLSVTDTGCGMTREQQRRALEPFYTTKAPGKGTGLGLSMVYGFVRQSGGSVMIYSEVDRGTTVALYFPKADGSGITTADESVPVSTVGDGRVVLVVEDDPAVRRLSEGRVAALGFEVIGASDAQEALDVLDARSDIAIVFSDLVMPGPMTGEGLAAKLAAERPEIGVLLTSGFSGGMANLEGIAGHPRLLRKPYRQADLAAAFAELMATR